MPANIAVEAPIDVCSGGLHQSTQNVARRTGGDHCKCCDTGASDLRQEHQKDRAEYKIAEKVRAAGVQAQRCDRAPPLALEHQSGLGRPFAEPVERKRFAARGGKEKQQQTQ